MPARGGDDEIWVPITINLPLGLTKAFTPTECAPLALLFGPFMIIMLAQMSNTMLLSVVPYLVREICNGDAGEAAVKFGMLQSTLWTSQTVLAPVLGYASDRLGRRPVILLSLLVSGLGNALLAMAKTVPMMLVARVVSGLGFQIALFRAYFADSSAKKEKAGKFGLIGVVQQFSLFAGPSIGGLLGDQFGQRIATFASAALFILAALITFVWQPDEAKVERTVQPEDPATHKTVSGVEMVKIDLSGQRAGSEPGCASDSAEASQCGVCTDNRVCRTLVKAWRFAKWLGGYDLYPLLSLNFYFRFSFAVYKSVFAFYCMSMLHFEKTQVGLLLSAMGIGGMFVQGVLVRVTVRSLGEERTLFVAMAAEAAGFIVLSYARGLTLLVPALSLIAIGYGLAVPCLTTLFANVPVEQGIMQGIAGFIDRFGQAFGPVLGGLIYKQLGAANLMLCTGVALACISSICLMFIGDGCAAWMREMFCYHAAQGYQQVGTEMAETVGEEMSELERADEDDGSTPNERAHHAQNGAAPLGPAAAGGEGAPASPKLARPAGGGRM